MDRPNSSSFLTIAGVTLLGGFLAYAAYFDYKRRNDPSFRKKIRTQKKQVDKAVAEDKQKEAARASNPLSIPRELLLAIHEKANVEAVPTNAEERHQYFVTVVATAERLAGEGPQNYLESGIYFYQALRVYPQPLELIAIYQKTVPEPVLAIVMELYNMDVIGHITGYYKTFPPQSMNVTLKKVDSNNTGGGQMRAHVLVASKSFKSGDIIYKESPIVAVLDPDLQGRGTHCSHCLREIPKDATVVPPSDRLGSVYCSEKCRTRCDTQSHDLLFSDKSPLPPEIAVDLPQIAVADRPKTQDALAEFTRQNASSGLLLVARLVALQIIAELAKTLPQAEHMKVDLPELSVSGPYTVYDHMERLRYIDVTLPEGEYSTLKNLLLATLPFLEDAHSDERHAMFRGKIAYNAIGIYHGEGRDDRPPTAGDEGLTRTPVGTARQVGSGLYFVSSYLTHSCNPSVRPYFNEGTSELHLVALRDIEEGEELTMAYVDVSTRPDEAPADAFARRRVELSRGWRFACTCTKCEEDKKVLGLEGSVDKKLLKDGSKLDFDYALKVQALPAS